MKFLCVECDEPMKLKESRGPVDGSMTVVFGCPACSREIAMLTNQMETQLVRSLDVKIGGQSQAPQTMETLRDSLATKRDDIFAADASATSATEAPVEHGSAGKCPFSGVVSDAYESGARTSADLIWTAEAQERVDRIPTFIRAMAQKGIEEYAREKGYKEIDATVMDEVKGRFGM